MITFSKIDGEWMLRVPASVVPFWSGQPVSVSLRNGATKQVTLGECRMTASDNTTFWTVARDAQRPTEVVGDLSRIVTMFDTARQNLRHPAIVLDGFRVNIAGGRAREPGSLTVTGVERTSPSRFGRGMTRQYFGRVTRAGVWEPSRGAPEGLGAKLRAFAADPAGQAAEYGRLHGSCCFCNRTLTDERSTAVGYGPDCAENYGLPWGTRPAPVSGAQVVRNLPVSPPASPQVCDEDDLATA